MAEGLAFIPFISYSKHPGCYFGGIILPSGKRGFAVYKDGKIVTQYATISKKKE